MTGLLVYLEPRVRQSRESELLLGAREQRVVIAPQHERRRANVAERRGGVVLQEMVDHHGPKVRWNFQAFDDDSIEKLRRQGPVRRTSLELTGERLGDRIRQSADCRLETLRDGRRRRKARADQHERRHALRMRNRNLARDEAAERMPDERRSFDVERVEQRNGISRELLKR